MERAESRCPHFIASAGLVDTTPPKTESALAGLDREVVSRAKARILCIDDHWNGLIGRKMLLEQSGYEVLEASGGDEGLKLFRSHAVDAVVVDYQMPGMNGDVVAAKMKRINSHVPIMLLSAYWRAPRSLANWRVFFPFLPPRAPCHRAGELRYGNLARC